RNLYLRYGRSMSMDCRWILNNNSLANIKGSKSEPVVKISWRRSKHYLLGIKSCISHTRAYPFLTTTL
ncbi:hypothetical protein J7K97_02665, partial [Candidatus Aerophobetes bacterium]|nr:hypothetical protein [Candidatus Aerophobetes bacterium]